LCVYRRPPPLDFNGDYDWKMIEMID
jgi:hypothetical protein